jgi:hypothetical protein
MYFCPEHPGRKQKKKIVGKNMAEQELFLPYHSFIRYRLQVTFLRGYQYVKSAPSRRRKTTLTLFLSMSRKEY